MVTTLSKGRIFIQFQNGCYHTSISFRSPMRKQTPKHRTLTLQRRGYSQFQRSLKIEAATVYDMLSSYSVTTQFVFQEKEFKCIKSL